MIKMNTVKFVSLSKSALSKKRLSKSCHKDWVVIKQASSVLICPGTSFLKLITLKMSSLTEHKTSSACPACAINI